MLVIGMESKNIFEEFITIIKDGSGVGKVRRLPKNSCFIGTMGGILSKESDIDFIYCCLLITLSLFINVCISNYLI